MILGRRGRLFGDARKSAFVREQEGGGGVIYGLQFNGISDYLSVTAVFFSYTGDFYTEFIVSDVPTTAAKPAFWTQNNSFRGFYYSSISYLVLISGTNTFPFTSYSASNTPPLTGLNTVRLTRTGSDADVTVNGETVSASGVNTGNLFLQSIGANPGDGNTFFQGVITEFSDSLVNVSNDANSWAGLTINGATRVQSTDGGLTWTPA